ncbi:ninjurin-2-like [Nylanderia fulva]|uniref:ninjurin-2-like n=1 Tax=Nylanderia fulva TaxID=613905 RepID=UPI0010FBA098|nr:ninjurin-2-like [Nylanderia fulva]XP_029176930.1 ninjurin-2-like [Nylanderia fulva]XP_029176931.1 ninjurin-2-like [Nylanderia fulva]XP_029176932.1 ninjurin-2-like [Nylanderia fulva]XP_029176934.1 ninjurin-2-like [Nylanderia fulva]XP_029176935.1 ninjurin-2-like [Nylanderia fulva]
MDGEAKISDQLSYLNEVHDNVSHPLTSSNSETVLPMFARAGFVEEADNNPVNNSSRRLSRTELEEKPDFNFRVEPEVRTPDVNVYQHKKTLAQGMMDLALLSANANQMRYVLQTDGRHPYFYPSLTMISLSLFLQIAVGVGLIWNSVYNVKEHEQMCKANKANNWTVIGIFFVTILNVFISSFGVVDQASIVT